MNLHRMSNRWALALLALIVLTPFQSFADDEEDSAPAVKAEPIQLRVIPLKHRAAEEMRGLLSQLNFGAGGAPANGTLRVAVDPRSKTLFLRGTEGALKKADLFIKAIDVPAERLTKLDVEGLLVYPLKHVQPNEVTSVLQQLGVANVRAVQLGDASVLIFSAKDDSTTQLIAVIEAMDKPSATVAATPATANSDE